MLDVVLGSYSQEYRWWNKQIYFVTVRWWNLVEAFDISLPLCTILTLKNQAKGGEKVCKGVCKGVSFGIISSIWLDVWRRYMGWWWIQWWIYCFLVIFHFCIHLSLYHCGISLYHYRICFTISLITPHIFLTW